MLHGPATPMLTASHTTSAEGEDCCAAEELHRGLQGCPTCPALASKVRALQLTGALAQGPPPPCSSKTCLPDWGQAANSGPSLPATQRLEMHLACCQAASRACLLPTPWLQQCPGRRKAFGDGFQLHWRCSSPHNSCQGCLRCLQLHCSTPAFMPDTGAPPTPLNLARPQQLLGRGG